MPFRGITSNKQLRHAKSELDSQRSRIIFPTMPSNVRFLLLVICDIIEGEQK